MNTYEHLTDRELTDRLHDQDIRAYEEIYNRHWAPMFQFARKLLQDNLQAEDVVQDTFVNLYLQIGKADFKNINIVQYLYRSIRNAVINLANRNKLNVSYIASLRDFINAGEFITDDKVRENEVAKQIELEIANLPRKMRALFEMSRKQYMTHKEIAEASNLSEETVKSQMKRALKLLRSRLSTFFFLQLMAAILYLNKIS
jgi:RNA polymerase sigma-70 factor (family 1)